MSKANVRIWRTETDILSIEALQVLYNKDNTKSLFWEPISRSQHRSYFKDKNPDFIASIPCDENTTMEYYEE